VSNRVYDADGRFDETAPLSLTRRDDRGLTDGVEDGSDGTAVRNIRVAGGAITVSGTDVVRGARVTALGDMRRVGSPVSLMAKQIPVFGLLPALILVKVTCAMRSAGWMIVIRASF